MERVNDVGGKIAAWFGASVAENAETPAIVVTGSSTCSGCRSWASHSRGWLAFETLGAPDTKNVVGVDAGLAFTATTWTQSLTPRTGASRYAAARTSPGSADEAEAGWSRSVGCATEPSTGAANLPTTVPLAS